MNYTSVYNIKRTDVDSFNLVVLLECTIVYISIQVLYTVYILCTIYRYYS